MRQHNASALRRVVLARAVEGGFRPYHEDNGTRTNTHPRPVASPPLMIRLGGAATRCIEERGWWRRTVRVQLWQGLLSLLHSRAVPAARQQCGRFCEYELHDGGRRPSQGAEMARRQAAPGEHREAVGPLQNGAEHCLAVVPQQAPGAGGDGTPLRRDSRPSLGRRSFLSDTPCRHNPLWSIAAYFRCSWLLADERTWTACRVATSAVRRQRRHAAQRMRDPHWIGAHAFLARRGATTRCGQSLRISAAAGCWRMNKRGRPAESRRALCAGSDGTPLRGFVTRIGSALMPFGRAVAPQPAVVNRCIFPLQLVAGG